MLVIKKFVIEVKMTKFVWKTDFNAIFLLSFFVQLSFL